MTTPLSGAVDLSAPQQHAEQIFDCLVPGGCGLRLRKQPHLRLEDCVLTCAAYVELYLRNEATFHESEAALLEVERELVRLRTVNADLLAANQRLLNGSG